MSKKPKIQGISGGVAMRIRHHKRIARIARQIKRRRDAGHS